MASTSIRGGFNRLFIVLTVAWVVWCGIVGPYQERERWLTSDLYDHVRHEGVCESSNTQNDSAKSDCLGREDERWHANIRQHSFGKVYSEMWMFILFGSLGVPLIVYGLIRGIAAVCVWVWHGYRSA